MSPNSAQSDTESRNIILLMLYVSVNTLGDWMSLSALGFIIYRIAGEFAVGYLLAVPLILGALAAPLVGRFMDKRFRSIRSMRRALLVLNLILAVLVFSLQWESLPWYVTALVLKEVTYLSGRIAYDRYLPRIVSSERLEQSFGVLSVNQQIAMGAGLALGPILASAIGPLVFALDALSFLLAAVLLLQTRSVRASTPTTPDPTDTPEVEGEEVGLLGAFRVASAIPGFRAALACYLLFSVTWGARETIGIALVEHHFGVDPRWVGTYYLLGTLGEAAGGLLIAQNRYLPGARNINRILLSMVLTGIAFFGVIFAGGHLILAGALKFIEGVGTGLGAVICYTLLVLKIPDEIRGSISGLVNTSHIIALASAKVLAGYLSVSLSPELVYAGIGLVVLVTIGALLGHYNLSRSGRAPALHSTSHIGE